SNISIKQDQRQGLSSSVLTYLALSTSIVHSSFLTGIWLILSNAIPCGYHRRRERCVGSRTTSSGVLRSKPVVASACWERSSNELRKFTRAALSLRMPSQRT